MQKIFIKIIILFCFINFLYSEEGNKTENIFYGDIYNKSLGFNFGVISATGLGYRQWNKNTGFQIAAGIFYNPSTNGLFGFSSRLLDYSIGFQYLFNLLKMYNNPLIDSRLYAFCGINHGGYIMALYNLNTSNYTVGNYTPTINLAGGIGFDVGFLKNFVVSLEGGYGFFYSPLSAFIDALKVDLFFQLALHYRFK